MSQLLRMPQVSADATKAVLGTWAVHEGASFRAGQVLATIETAKAAVDVEAEADGVLVKALVGEGSEVDVGTPLALLCAPGEQIPDVAAALDSVGASASRQSSAAQREPRDHGARIFASPLARRLARDAQLDLADLRGTGPHNRIVRRDVEAAIAAAHDQMPQPERLSSVPNGHRDEPISRMRREIARRLSTSWQTVPHFYLRGTAHADALLRLRAELNDGAAVPVSLTDLVLKAAGSAYLRVPAMNAVWTDTAIRRFDSVDLAVAVATDEGLVTPVLRSVESMAISTLAAATSDLAARARSGRLRPDELDGGVATVSNLGMFGTEEFAAIINPPQSAILAVGAARAEPIAVDGQFTVGTVLRVTLSVDHRPLDGATAASWMREFLRLLEKPTQILR